jgi:histidinol phosphatase-like enzyme (inositol monophosphatase family)
MESGEIENFLHELCEVAARETLPRFRRPMSIDNKLDGGFDPVTIADQQAEAAIRAHVARQYPAHGVIGEESPAYQENAEYCWIIDPIDGTRAFISGLPSWGTLIGLTRNKTPVAGIMHQPFTGERYLATGDGAFLVHHRLRTGLRTSSRKKLAEATLLTTSPFHFPDRKIAAYQAVERQCRLARYGFDCYGYAMVAAGHVDLVIESDLNAFDIVALIPIIEQAGGVVTNWQGDVACNGGDILASANPQLHEQALAILSG